MRAVVQRVSQANVCVEGIQTGTISAGLLVLLGVEKGDTETDLTYCVNKTVGLRIFDDHDGKMNLSIIDTGGEILIVSQFTLLGDARKGRRPSFVQAADPPIGNRFYELYISRVREKNIAVATGKFGADMQVSSVNDGPVTILLDSRKVF